MRLRNAPLVHVLAQVVFSPVLNWLDHVPALQDQLIDIGFLRVERRDLTEISFTVGSPAVTTTKPRWEFADRDQQAAFILSESSLALQTTAYLSRQPFLDSLQQGLEILQRTLKVRLTQRMGLRYIDFVQPDADERFALYVHEGLLGYPFRTAPKLGTTGGAFATQSIASTPHGTLAIRSFVLPPGQFLPPDLEPGSLRQPAWNDASRAGLAVDFDHYTIFGGPDAPSPDFDPTSIISHMNNLHRTLRDAFDVIATEHAFERWGPWEQVGQS